MVFNWSCFILSAIAPREDEDLSQPHPSDSPETRRVKRFQHLWRGPRPAEAAPVEQPSRPLQMLERARLFENWAAVRGETLSTPSSSVAERCATPSTLAATTFLGLKYCQAPVSSTDSYVRHYNGFSPSPESWPEPLPASSAEKPVFSQANKDFVGAVAQNMPPEA